MKVYIACDHNGFRLKQSIKKHIRDLKDLTPKFKPGDDYPLIAQKLCKKIKKDEKGILICGSGIGVCIASNRFKGIRAAVCHSQNEAKLAKAHDDVNVLCLSAWSLTTDKALKIIKKWLSSSFSSAPRFIRRIKQLEKKWR